MQKQRIGTCFPQDYNLHSRTLYCIYTLNIHNLLLKNKPFLNETVKLYTNLSLPGNNLAVSLNQRRNYDFLILSTLVFYLFSYNHIRF